MNKQQNQKRHAIITFIIILLISVTAFYAVSVPRNISNASANGGVLNLTGEDFSQTLFKLNGEWEFYFGQLLTPEDFLYGTPQGGTLINAPMSWAEAGYPLEGFTTYRLTILMDEPELMMLVPEIMDASKIWINGRLVFEAGTVGTTVTETETGIRNAFITFAPQDGQVEIIIQAANYGWFISGLTQSVTIGRPDVLMGDAMLRRILLAAVLGMFIALALYHIVLFVYSRREWIYLVFALLCLFTTGRFLLEVNGFAQLFLPGGVGAGLTKLYMVFLILFIGCCLVFMHLAFRMNMGKIRRTVYVVFIFAPLAVILVLPYGMVNVQIGFLTLIPLAVSFIEAARSKQIRENPYHMLFLIAMGAFCLWFPITVILLNDALYMQGILTNIFLVLSQCAVLSVSYAEAKRRAMEADIREQSLAADNAMLDSLNRMKSDFLANVSHEMCTPLTVMSGYAQQTRIEIENGEVNDETTENLKIIQSEAYRLSELAHQLLNASKNVQTGIHVSLIKPSEILERAAKLCEPILAKNGNLLEIKTEPNCPAVTVNPDMILQVILNLCTNANRHTQNGTVIISVKRTGGFATITAEDNGAGIAPELLPRVFERGVSGDGRAGLGLAICKDVIIQHNGDIEIENKRDKGVRVIFTLPLVKTEASL